MFQDLELNYNKLEGRDPKLAILSLVCQTFTTSQLIGFPAFRLCVLQTTCEWKEFDARVYGVPALLYFTIRMLQSACSKGLGSMQEFTADRVCCIWISCVAYYV